MIGAVQGLLEIDALVEGLIDACHEAIPSDWVSINDVAPVEGPIIAVVQPDLPQALFEEFRKYAHQNPLLQRYMSSRDGRAYRFSDVISVGEYHALELYAHVYQPIGLEHQLAFMLQSTADRVLAVVLSRRERDFTDAEVELANSARPFLIQAWNNAAEFTSLRDELATRSEVPGTLAKAPLAELIARGLTERQAEVLVLAACGRSNGDAAESLGISERTVEKHLERCYRALGVTGRSAAAALVWSLVSDFAAAPDRRGLEGRAPARASE
ncbi:MAG: helix-turn-helix transcriptional regulator [Solirubrobacterales bacterium]